MATTCFKYGDASVLAVGALLSLDLALVDSLVNIKVSRSGRPGMMPSERLTTAVSILKRKVPYSEYEEAVFKAISEVLHISIFKGELTEKEELRTSQLLPKYESEQWTLTGEYNVD